MHNEAVSRSSVTLARSRLLANSSRPGRQTSASLHIISSNYIIHNFSRSASSTSLSILLNLVLRGAVGVRCLDSAVWVLPHPCTIRIEDVLLSTRVLDGLHAVLLDSLDCSVRKDGLLLAISEDAFDCAVWESKVLQNDKLKNVIKVRKLT